MATGRTRYTIGGVAAHLGHPVARDELIPILAAARASIRDSDVAHAAACRAMLDFLIEPAAAAATVLRLSAFAGWTRRPWRASTFDARVSGLNNYLRDVVRKAPRPDGTDGLRPAAVRLPHASGNDPEYVFVWVADELKTLKDVPIVLPSTSPPPLPPHTVAHIIRGFTPIVEYNKAVVRQATSILVTTGSRSRDPQYLKAIEERLQELPRLKYYRVLYGPPHKQVFKDHLLRLLEIRSPHDRTYGYQTLHVSMFNKVYEQQEFCLCANEHEALLVLPPTGGFGFYDTALVVRNVDVVSAWVGWGQALYLAPGHDGRLETAQAVSALKVLETKRNHGK